MALDRTTLVIDPTDMTEDESAILYFILKKQIKKREHYFDQQELFPLLAPEILRLTGIDILEFENLKLKYSIVQWESLSEFEEPRFEVYGAKIGHGNYSEFYNSLGTLIPVEDHHLECVDKNRAIKHQEHNKEQMAVQNFMKIVNNEFQMGRRDRRLGMKGPVFFPVPSKSLGSAIVMKFIEGEELKKIIIRDRLEFENENRITTDTRVDISIAVGIALETLERLGTVHGDIKSENIIVNLNAPFVTATIIDRAGARDANFIQLLDETFIFTEIYAAPEVSKGYIDSRSDLYSSGWVFDDIWRGDQHPAKILQKKYSEKIANLEKQLKQKDKTIEEGNKKINKATKQMMKHCEFKHLFAGIEDLDPKHCHFIEGLLKRNANVNMTKRGNYAELVDVFEQISFDRMISRTFPPTNDNTLAEIVHAHHIAEFETAHKLGVSLRRRLSRFLSYDNPTIKYDDLEYIREIFSNVKIGVPAIANKKEVLAWFIKCLRVEAFQGLTSHQEILDKLKDIIDTYKSNMTALNNMVLPLNGLPYRIQHNFEKNKELDNKFDFDLIQKKIEQMKREMRLGINKMYRQLTLDKINSIGAKLKTRVEKLQAEMKELEKFANGSIKDFKEPQQCNGSSLFFKSKEKPIPKKHKIKVTEKNYASPKPTL